MPPPALPISSTVASKTPPGFFDSMDGETAAKKSRTPAMQPPPSRISTFDDVNDQNNQSGVVAVKIEAPAIPEGFFDNVAADDKARAVDVKAKRKAEESAQWAEFSAFTDDIELSEAARESAEDARYSQRDARADVESE
jgi:hypothetical protein